MGRLVGWERRDRAHVIGVKSGPRAQYPGKPRRKFYCGRKSSVRAKLRALSGFDIFNEFFE
jgi:hypothetical protein